MRKKQTTIFSQLIKNIILPVMFALLALGIINYRQTKNIIEESNQTKNNIINNEITLLLEYRDISLELLEIKINDTMKYYSNRIVSMLGNSVNNVESLDLYRIKKQLGMKDKFDDIYIINKDGIIVNTTFEKDKNLNLFSFGEAHKNYLLEVFNEGKFVSERFTIESSTKRLRKYTYQPTNDDKYIVEIGSYSQQADDIISEFKERLKSVSNVHKSIRAVDLFISADNPFSLSTGTAIDGEHARYLKSVFDTQIPFIVEDTTDGAKLLYHYEYMKRRNTNLYEGAVLCIVSDRTLERQMLKKELTNFVLIFVSAISILLLLIYRKAKVISSPIKKLAQNISRITKGDLSERAEVVGNNEVTKLATQFNEMISQLESYTNKLEEKVKERTAEIEQQKEEIETQRDSLAEQKEEIETQRDSLAKQQIILEKTNKDLGVAYKQIEDSILYAKKIQEAILPPDEYVNEILPDSFFLYMPKDIVSGDFYWASKKEDNVLVAAIDCTGHGVPGAFMSIVGNDQLNYAVNVKGARRPDHILNELDACVIRTLRQTDKSESVKDGMDLALCSFNFKEMTLDYAGAFNPLVLIRNGEVEITKADKFPIGGGISNYRGKKFTNHHIKLKKGDAIYIYSDGYADQFGGPENKKFMSKNMRNLLLDIHLKPISEQETILKQTIINWMGKEEQIDDILVFGIKI